MYPHLDCAATIRHPITGLDVHCTRSVDQHRGGWHHAGTAPDRVYWPDHVDGCPAWTISPTAMGDVVVYCGYPAAESHRRHEGHVGMFPVRWESSR